MNKLQLAKEIANYINEVNNCQATEEELQEFIDGICGNEDNGYTIESTIETLKDEHINTGDDRVLEFISKLQQL